MSVKTLGLVADIGGTHARFALALRDGESFRLERVEVLPCARFASLEQAAAHYLSQCPERPRAGSFAVASPISGDDVRMVNRAWAFNREDLRQRLGLESLCVINDFGAIARALPWLPTAAFELLHGDPNALPAPISVLGPGTGLGVALLLRCPRGDWQVVETEGGHAGFAPQSPEEQRIARWLKQRHGRCSNERLLCGAGLRQIEAALRGLPPDIEDGELRDPAEIVAAALAGEDVLARRTLARFCAVLGSVSGDCALMHGARSVVIAGGIVPRFVPFLRASAFRERFLAKGRFADYLAGVQIRVIVAGDPGLLGAASVLAEVAP